MKKLLAITIPIALLLTGCGSSKVAVKSNSLDFESYFAAIRADGGYYGQAATNEELIKLGASACYEFEHGATITDLAQSMPIENEEQKQFLSSQIAASLAFLCPEYLDTAG